MVTHFAKAGPQITQIRKTLPIVDCQLPIEKIGNIQSSIKNRQSAMFF